MAKVYDEESITILPVTKRMHNLTGQRFTRLTILGLAESVNGKTFWWAKCDCGNIIKARSDQLKNERTKSCSCLRKERFEQNRNRGGRNREELTGQIFGHLTAIKDTGKRQKMGKGTSAIWLCQCDCNIEHPNFVEVTAGHLKSGHTTSCGCIKSRGERKIIELLKQNNIEFVQQKSFDTCRFSDTNRKAKFDFYILNQKYLIEYDGEQHFDCKHRGWNNQDNFQKIQSHDKYKNQWCKDNNIHLIRIPYTHYDRLTFDDLDLETSRFVYC